MKKRWIAVSMTTLLVLGGCSALEEVNNTLTYVNEATEYVQEASTFAEEIPALAEQAVNDTAALAELETALQDMKQEMEAFTELQAPEIAADLHQQIVEQSNAVAEGIELYLNSMEDGKLDPAVLENTDIFQPLQEIVSIIDQIKELGQ